MNRSEIEWTDATWNPVTGCTKVSAGCKHCYAETMAIRLQAMGANGYDNGFGVSLMPERLTQPIRIRKPTRFFVNSMSDLFHPKVPFEYVTRIIEVIRATPQHQYQILTKRAERMARYFLEQDVPSNAWIGVTVENNRHGIPRIEHLRKIHAITKFLSIEPLLEELNGLNLDDINWVIVGGESGRKARPMQEMWVDAIYEQCRSNNVAFFFKQWGSWGPDNVKRSKKSNGRIYRGKVWNMFPVTIQT